MTDNEQRRGPGRPPMNRPDMRADGREDPRTQPRLQRKHRNTEDKFYVPEECKTHGYDYNWKTIEIAGKPVDAYDLTALEENHWEPVTAEEMSQIASKGAKGAIVKSGMMLMKRPAYLSEEARAESEGQAFNQAGAKRAELTSKGDQNFPTRQASVNSQYGALSVPD